MKLVEKEQDTNLKSSNSCLEQSNQQCQLHAPSFFHKSENHESHKNSFTINAKIIYFALFSVSTIIMVQFIVIYYQYSHQTIMNRHCFGRDLPYLNSLQYSMKSKQQQQALIRSMKFWILDRQFNIQNNETLKQFALEEINYYQEKYGVSKYDQIQFCVLVFNKNNVAQNRYLYNLNSIVNQNYTNFHVYYIDDHSTDGNPELVQQYIQKYNVSSKITLIKNDKYMGKAYNMWTVAKKNCKPGSIMFPVDGDDDLIGRQVLKHFNMLYQTTGAYYIYSIQTFTNQANHKIDTYTSELSTYSLQNHEYRKYFLPNQQHTWISDLFLDLPIEFYQLDGQFPMAAEDIASNFAMMESSGSKVYHSKQLTYHYNTMTGNAVQQKYWLRQKITAFRFRYLTKKAPVYTKQIKFRKIQVKKG